MEASAWLPASGRHYQKRGMCHDQRSWPTVFGGYRPLVDTRYNHFARLNNRYSPTHTPPTPTIISGYDQGSLSSGM